MNAANILFSYRVVWKTLIFPGLSSLFLKIMFSSSGVTPQVSFYSLTSWLYGEFCPFFRGKGRQFCFVFVIISCVFYFESFDFPGNDDLHYVSQYLVKLKIWNLIHIRKLKAQLGKGFDHKRFSSLVYLAPLLSTNMIVVSTSVLCTVQLFKVYYVVNYIIYL